MAPKISIWHSPPDLPFHQSISLNDFDAMYNMSYITGPFIERYYIYIDVNVFCPESAVKFTKAIHVQICFNILISDHLIWKDLPTITGLGVTQLKRFMNLHESS